MQIYITSTHECKPSEALSGPVLLFQWTLKGKYHQNLLSFQNPKMFDCQQKQRIIVKFVKNYHPSAIKLSISASGQRQSRPVWIET